MTEMILVVIAVLAALAIAARRAALPGRNFPEPLDRTADVSDDESEKEEVQR